MVVDALPELLPLQRLEQSLLMVVELELALIVHDLRFERCGDLLVELYLELCLLLQSLLVVKLRFE